MPRYVLEVLFIISALLVIGLLFVTAGEGQALSLIALFVAAGFRILPSVVRIVGSRNTVRTGLPQMELDQGPDRRPRRPPGARASAPDEGGAGAR